MFSFVLFQMLFPLFEVSPLSQSLPEFIILFQDLPHLFCEALKVNYFLPLETHELQDVLISTG